MPRKIRDLLKDLRKAGFTLAPGGKGSHRKFEHPAVKIPAIIPGRDGDDAKAYLERHIAEDLVTFLTHKGRLLPSPSTDSNNPDPVAIRSAMGFSQTKFAQFIGVSVRTLHKWEQHTSSPSGAAKTLLRIAATNPHAVREALRSA